jgi:hypothetical protein
MEACEAIVFMAIRIITKTERMGGIGLDWNAVAIVDRLKLFFRWSRARENKIPSLFKTFKAFFLLICYCANTI